MSNSSIDLFIHEIRGVEMKFYYILLALLIPVALLFSGCVTQEEQKQETIKIGFVGPLSGDLALYGNTAKVAMEYAASKFNNEIEGKKIEFFYEDDKCDAKASVEAYTKLINVDKVQYVIGGLCSSETLSGAPIAEQAKVVNISYCSSSPDVRSLGDYSFVLYPLDDAEGKESADYIYNKLSIKKVAMLNAKTEFNTMEAKLFKEAFIKLGGEIVFAEENNRNEKDFRTQLAKVKEANPEMIYAAEYIDEITNLLLQAKELDINVPFFTPQTLTQEVVDKVGNAAEGSYTILSQTNVSDPNYETEILKRNGNQKVDAGLCNGWAHDAMYAIKTAADKANSTDPTLVKDALYNVEFTGALGTHSFDKDGILAKANFKIMKAVNNKMVEQK
jgi:branched-chain amino acid transport system substrate-binding protein